MLEVGYTLLGIPFHKALRKDAVDIFRTMLEEEGVHIVCTPNPEIMLVALEKPSYYEILQKASWNLPDGIGLLWAATFWEWSKDTKNVWKVLWTALFSYACLVFAPSKLRTLLPETILGSDTFFQVHAWLASKQIPVFYFGGDDGVALATAKVMKEKHSGLVVAGACGGFPFRSKEESDAILEHIASVRPQVLFVALSFPQQEEWMSLHKEFLASCGVKILMGIGGTFNFATNRIARAPAWMRRLHLEWLWRLIKEPARYKRILRAVIIFPYKVVQKRLEQL